LNIIDAYTSDRYNGNIQAHFSKNIKKNIPQNVQKILINEKKAKLDNVNTYQRFSQKIEDTKKNLEIFLNRNSKSIVVGKSYPARASVILNYFSFLKSRIKLIAEQPTSLKLNKYISGTNIKIVDSKILKKLKPDIIIIFAWHLFTEIKNKWKQKGLPKKTKYVLVLPKLKIFR
jgi:hypothetical protein